MHEAKNQGHCTRWFHISDTENEGVLLHSGRTHPVMRETPLSVLFSTSVQKIVPDSDKFQSAERHSSLHSTSWYIPRCFVLPVSGQSIWQYNTRHPRPFHLSQSSKTVPVSTAYLRYAVCRCCLCNQILMAASIGHQALNFMHSIYDFKSFTMFMIHRRCSKVNILLIKFLKKWLHG